ncbi:Acetylcholinesterase-1 like protein [Argiope bruennichi]|uniref:acetylcholinesterase n=1 Tax=Argiope bruennichi TaxID=94029 RepID=A0A8T0E2J1_ARGBR|nr:Acetylcholinesterase-1 like protein [Argiope bruennichi]
MNISAILILALIFGSASSCYLDKYVHTLSGPVQGFLNDINQDPVEVFLGIPYAQPPIGKLRFQKPKPLKPWTKTLEAIQMPPACAQYTPYPFPWVDTLPGKSEDCLYLNIYSPIDAKNGSNLAVLFWIHGGGFTYGSNRMDVYDASALAVHGNVIVVTINYRMGVFGFVTSNTEDAPGNVGMYDMLMALAMGLFSKAILQSGTAILLKSNQLEPNLEHTQRLAEAVGCASKAKTIKNDPESVLGCLRSKTAHQLARVFWSFNPTSTRSFFPQYGDGLLPRNALDEIRKGNFHNIPILTGNTRDEGSFQITTKQPEVFGFFGHKNPIINKTQAENMIRGIFRSSDNPEKYVEYYLGNIPDDDYDAIKTQVYTASGDSSLLCETVYFAESYADRGNDVYFYLFTHRPSNTPWSSWMGAAHAEEVQFVFGRPIRKPYLYEPQEVALSRKMIDIWTNFAKNGVPSDSFNWPKYSKENPTFVYIDAHFEGDKYGTGPIMINMHNK